MFVRVDLGKDWKCVTHLEHLFSLKRTWQHSLSLQTCIWTNHKNSEKMFFWQMRANWVFLTKMHSTTYKVYQHEYLKPSVKHGGGGLKIWVCFPATGPGHCCISKYSRVRCEVIGATGQWSQAQQQIYSRVAEKEKNQVAINDPVIDG